MTEEMEKTASILITGASGFIGSFIVEEGLARGFDVWAGVRSTSSKVYLQDHRIRFANLDLGNPQKLRAQLSELKTEMGGRGWDYVVHAAGATKCLRAEDFFRTNTDGTRHLVEALRSEEMMPRRFVFVSSLSIFGAIREEPVRTPTADNPWRYAPILDSDKPQPNTAYGRSKLLAEQYLMEQQDVPLTILRPTGVYGPREKDYFLMAQSIQRHTDFAVGFCPQEITFVYHSRRFSDLLQRELGNPWVLHIKAPLWFLRAVCWVSGRISRLTGRMNALNDDKYHILAQRNWQCDIEPARRDFGYEPQWDLERGVAASVKWYKENGWL